MKLYTAGGMHGYPERNFPAFRQTAEILRGMHHDVTSPVEMETGPDATPGSAVWAKFLARDVMIIASPEVEAIVVLDGWEHSRGASLEVHVARELGKKIYRLAQTADGVSYLVEVQAPTKYQLPSDENVLEEAGRVVGNGHGNAYGHPGEVFTRIAGAWKALFGWDVTPAQVALAMVVVKLSRLYETPDKRDSIVDIAGYARTYEMVIERAKD